MESITVFLIGLLEQIKNEEIVLPDIQRDFVWDERSARAYVCDSFPPQWGQQG